MEKYNKILEAIQKGINIALDDFEDADIQSQKPLPIIDRNYTKEVLDQYSNIVDLGLPSGTIWARFNIGVSPSDNLSIAENWKGNYYAWGETKPKEIYNYQSYLYHGDEKATEMKNYYITYIYPNDNGGILKSKDDAAYVNTNGIYRMPTSEEFDELIEYTTQKYIMHYKDINGLNGWLFTSIYNKEELFFPETNWKADNEVAQYNISMNYSCVAFYWSKSLNTGNTLPCYLNLSKSSFNDFIATLRRQREFGMTIRGVLNK